MIDLEQRGPEKKNFENRLVLIYVFFVFLFSGIILQAYSLQVSSFIDYEEAFGFLPPYFDLLCRRSLTPAASSVPLTT